METFETGEHITKYVEMGPGAPHNADLAALGSGAMLQMMLVDNFVHADLHPGVRLCCTTYRMACVIIDNSSRPCSSILSCRRAVVKFVGHVSAGNIMVHLDPPRGTRALYERIAERIGLKVGAESLSGCGCAVH